MHQIRYFLAVARTLNFTRAAEQCNVAQPSLTRAIQKLEEELGGLLLHRERQHTHLTELGRLMLPHLERTYTAAEAARDLAQGLRQGQLAPLRIGVSSMISAASLVELLEGLRTCIKSVELSLMHAAHRELVASALEGAFDIVFLADTAELPDRMRSWILFGETCRIILPRNHRLANLPAIDIGDLAGESIIQMDECADFERFKSACSGTDDGPHFRHRVNGPDDLQRLVLSGFGLGLLPAHIPLISGLVARPLGDAELKRNVIVAIVAGRPFTTATEACLRLARSRDFAPAFMTEHSA